MFSRPSPFEPVTRPFTLAPGVSRSTMSFTAWPGATLGCAVIELDPTDAAPTQEEFPSQLVGGAGGWRSFVRCTTEETSIYFTSSAFSSSEAHESANKKSMKRAHMINTDGSDVNFTYMLAESP
jgi:hypothetical protein